MTRNVMDGDVYIGGEPFDVDDETRTLIHVPCGTHLFGDTTIADHQCFECPNCHERFTELPVIDSENGQGYCTDDCHADAVWDGMTEARCARCGDPQREHLDRNGRPRQGWRLSRFTGSGFCNAQHKSGGIAGSVQWCGCLGYEEQPA